MNENNVILAGDATKCSAYLQYADDITQVCSYVEARKSTHKGVKTVVFFGLQMFLKRYLTTPITMDDIDEAETVILAMGLPFNRDGWERVVTKHKGYIPVHIKAVPEGTQMPVGSPLVQIMNKDPQLPWMTNYIESVILRAVWYPSTVCTMARELKYVIEDGLIQTVGYRDDLNDIIRDVTVRSNTSNESTGISGLAHAITFNGTDVVMSAALSARYYNHTLKNVSYPSSEHNTVTVNGMQNELVTFENMLERFEDDYKKITIVADSYNIYDAIDVYLGDILKDRINAYGKAGGVLNVRVDSGDIFGDPSIAVECVEHLMEKFGSSNTKTGYKVLPNHIRVMIECDWHDLDTYRKFVKLIKTTGLALDNFILCIDGGIYNVDRNDFNFVVNCSVAHDTKGWRRVYKNPFHRGKKSKGGVFTSVNAEGKYTMGDDDMLQDNILKTVYNGTSKLPANQKLKDVIFRARLRL